MKRWRLLEKKRNIHIKEQEAIIKMIKHDTMIITNKLYNIFKN